MGWRAARDGRQQLAGVHLSAAPRPRTRAPARYLGKLLLSQSLGYRLVVGPDELDLHRFERLAEDGRKALATGDAELSARRLGAALALWHGPALADCGNESFAIAERVRLEQLRLRALEDRVQAHWTWASMPTSSAS